jgi:hypothetical protein
MIELQPDGVLFLRSFLAVTTGIVVLFVGKGLNGRFRLSCRRSRASPPSPPGPSH